MFGTDVRICANMRFAVTDIETTGSHASGNSIIEIGIVVYDGENIVEEFSTLLDPGVRIPSYITGLTSITSEMVQGAPTFYQIADRLEEIFDGAIFVAHNVNFDHSFIRAEFAAIGRNWNPPRLCTIRLARKAFPGQNSYGLNAVCGWMGLNNEQAHRALSDARVATEILARALPLLDPADLKKMVAKHSGVVFLPPNLPEDTFHRLPEAPGVYYLYDEKGKPLYIGKANNIKKRVKQHFTTHAESAKAQSFMRDVVDVSFEVTGNELIALLLEDTEIRRHWPPHNRLQKRKVLYTFIIQYEDQNGFQRLAMSNIKSASAITSFPSVSSARKWLHELSHEFSLDARMIGLDVFDITLPVADSVEHNHALQLALKEVKAREISFIMEGPGRITGELGFVLVERGKVMGYAFLPADNSDLSGIHFHLKPLAHSENSSSILEGFSFHRIGFRRIDLN
jgi:DNA polymerase-3 subunit epsilon